MGCASPSWQKNEPRIPSLSWEDVFLSWGAWWARLWLCMAIPRT